MKACEEAGMSKDEVNNLSKERTKLELLKSLRDQNPSGPFTNPEETQKFLETVPESQEKNKRLYDEVRYARLSSLSLKESAAVFRLKRDYKNLDSIEYGENLLTYFGAIQACSTITKSDLMNILHGMLLAGTASNEVEPGEDFTIGSHVAAVWTDDSNTIDWYLGIIESVKDDGMINIKYLQKLQKDGSKWVCPVKADVWETKPIQIIMKNVMVKYACSLRIVVTLTSNEQLEELNKLVYGSS